MEQWGVWCVVSGGATGYRTGWLKSHGKEELFEGEKSARERAESMLAGLEGHGSKVVECEVCSNQIAHVEAFYQYIPTVFPGKPN